MCDFSMNMRERSGTDFPGYLFGWQLDVQLLAAKFGGTLGCFIVFCCLLR